MDSMGAPNRVKHRHGTEQPETLPDSRLDCDFRCMPCHVALADILAHFFVHNGAYDGESIVHRERDQLSGPGCADPRQVRWVYVPRANITSKTGFGIG